MFARQAGNSNVLSALALFALGVVLFATAVSRAADPAAPEAFKKVASRTAALRKEKKIAEAIAAWEAFLHKFPDNGWHTEQAVARILGLLGSPDGKQLRTETWRRAASQFTDCPAYCAAAAASLAGQMTWGAPGVPRAPDKALEFIDDTLAGLGDRFPKNFYFAYRLFGFRIEALRNAGKLAEAVDMIPKTAEAVPAMIHSPAFLLPVVNCAKLQKDPKQRIEAAKLYWVLCDFTGPAVNRATELVAKALTGLGGPGLARQFANAQQDVKAPNPLRDFEIYPIGDPEKMLEAAGDDPTARFNAFLVAGRIRDALDIAKSQLRKAADTNPGLMPAALRNFARCFKAVDLNVLRANQYLEYQRTGEGENPLLEFEADLERAKSAPPQK